MSGVGASPNSPSPGNAGYRGAEWFLTGGSGFNAISFLVGQILAKKAFAAIVQVVAVSGGGVGRPPTVAVQPMVSQVDGFGNQVPHATIYNIPCFRLQGGAGAVILDPIVGDIGEAIICDRDISKVKSTGKLAGPGSRRQNNWSDGCYFGSFLGRAPTSYVQITQSGINVISDGIITLTGSQVIINGIDFSPHVHGGVMSGGDDTGPPI